MKPENAAPTEPPTDGNQTAKPIPAGTELSTTAEPKRWAHSLTGGPALVFLRGELLAVPIPLERSEVTLGRALDADVRINDIAGVAVARAHPH